MSFNIRDLSVLSYAQGFTHWHARVDTPDHASAPGFFDKARDMLAVGDVITVSGSGGARMLCVVGLCDRVMTAGML